MRKLGVTGDGFGLAVPVNEAIEAAHRRGILTSASLMVVAEAATDAAARASRLPTLKVGLHLVPVDGRAVLSQEQIPDLVNKRGTFQSDPVVAGFKYFFMSKLRPQLEAEILAQLNAFRHTGLALDHVNGHNHLHLPPTVLRLILKVGREYGLRAMRLQYEPVLPSWRASKRGLLSKLASSVFLFPWIPFLKMRLRRACINCNDFVPDVHDSGSLQQDILLRILKNLPHGVTEIYYHPATRRCAELDRAMPDYQYEQEYQVLISPVVRETIVASGFQRIAFSEL